VADPGIQFGGAHGEREPITGVWGQSPLKLKAF